MASTDMEDSLETIPDFINIVYGYIRENFGKKCWIDEIFQVIVQFYANKGGSLYVFGNRKNGRLGIKSYKQKCNDPTLCAPFDQSNVMDISAGSSHTLLVDIYNDAWSCGYGKSGALGHDEARNVNVFTQIELSYFVVAVSAGEDHSLFLCNNGYVLSCGSNEHGQLGHGDRYESLTPKVIQGLEQHKIIQISAGSMFSAALTEDGDLFCFGLNNNGQCGVPNLESKLSNDKKGAKKRHAYRRSAKKYKQEMSNNDDVNGSGGICVLLPTRVDLDNVAYVTTGQKHSLLITKSGLTYSFGSGANRLGRDSWDWKNTPGLIGTLKKVKMKTCAAGYNHSLCVDYDGNVWSFGGNAYGQCGHPSNSNPRYRRYRPNGEQQRTPLIIKWFVINGIKATSCAAGTYSSSVIAEDGSLFMFGDNSKFKLGLPEIKNYHEPEKISMPQDVIVQKVSMGAQHSVVICSSF